MASEGSGDTMLMRVAVFGITISLVCTMMITVLLVDNQGDYDYDDINRYRDELGSFTGESMLSSTPWVLTAVYTPWVANMGTEGHIDPDGFLYGEGWTSPDGAPASIASELGKAADIRLDPLNKSSVPLSLSDQTVPYQFVTGLQWWADGEGILQPIEGLIGTLLGQDPHTYDTGYANSWQYTGYRYVFDPTLPFKSGTSSVDGSLSIVWYSYNGQEGISGGLQIYGGDVLLAHYAASDIINDYDATSTYATTYDFDFGGTHLNLSIRFDEETLQAGTPLMQAFAAGSWSMAVSSVSAGNFYDVDNSVSFVSTAGSMIDTFVSIFTFSTPSIDNVWMDLILWLIVALPFTIAMLCIALRLAGGFLSIL